MKKYSSTKNEIWTQMPSRMHDFIYGKSNSEQERENVITDKNGKRKYVQHHSFVSILIFTCVYIFVYFWIVDNHRGAFFFVLTP